MGKDKKTKKKKKSGKDERRRDMPIAKTGGEPTVVGPRPDEDIVDLAERRRLLEERLRRTMAEFAEEQADAVEEYPDTLAAGFAPVKDERLDTGDSDSDGISAVDIPASPSSWSAGFSERMRELHEAGTASAGSDARLDSGRVDSEHMSALPVIEPIPTVEPNFPTVASHLVSDIGSKTEKESPASDESELGDGRLSAAGAAVAAGESDIPGTASAFEMIWQDISMDSPSSSPSDEMDVREHAAPPLPGERKDIFVPNYMPLKQAEKRDPSPLETPDDHSVRTPVPAQMWDAVVDIDASKEKNVGAEEADVADKPVMRGKHAKHEIVEDDTARERSEISKKLEQLIAEAKAAEAAAELDDFDIDVPSEDHSSAADRHPKHAVGITPSNIATAPVDDVDDIDLFAELDMSYGEHQDSIVDNAPATATEQQADRGGPAPGGYMLPPDEIARVVAQVTGEFAPLDDIESGEDGMEVNPIGDVAEAPDEPQAIVDDAHADVMPEDEELRIELPKYRLGPGHFVPYIVGGVFGTAVGCGIHWYLNNQVIEPSSAIKMGAIALLTMLVLFVTNIILDKSRDKKARKVADAFNTAFAQLKKDNPVLHSRLAGISTLSEEEAAATMKELEEKHPDAFKAMDDAQRHIYAAK